MQNQSLPENYRYTHLMSLSLPHTHAFSRSLPHFYRCVGNFSRGNVSPKLQDKRAKLMPCGIGLVIFKDAQRFSRKLLRLSGQQGERGSGGAL